MIKRKKVVIIMDEKHLANEEVFEEEVPSSNLYSKRDVDDHIYVYTGFKNRVKFILLLALILIILSLLYAVFGYKYLNKEYNERQGMETVIKYNLLVIHTNDLYGGYIKNFAGYTTSDDAYKYDFSVKNDNPVGLNYSIRINATTNVDDVSFSMINYSLSKNNSIVSSGSLEDVIGKDIYLTEILSRNEDNYVLKIWSDKVTSNVSLTYKVNVIV